MPDAADAAPISTTIQSRASNFATKELSSIGGHLKISTSRGADFVISASIKSMCRCEYPIADEASFGKSTPTLVLSSTAARED
jgi:hypothetical protein